jgi:hypothetical protein
MLLIAALLAATSVGPQPVQPTSMSVRQGKAADGGAAWVVDCINCSGGGGGVASSVSVTGAVGVNILDGGTLQTNLSSIDAKTPALVSGRIPVDGSAVTQPVAVASSVLPSGAATDSLQTTGNSTLTTINGKLPALVSGRIPVDGSGVTQPVSGTVTTSPPSNASTNVAQLAGSSIAVNSGSVSAGTQRVVLATDQPQLTNALKVDGSGVTQPVSGTVTAQGAKSNNFGAPGATNLGVLPALANSGAPTWTEGTQVLLSTDLSGAVRVTGTVTTSPPSNASTNIAQVNGAAVNTGTGAAGAGTMRVAVASDSSIACNAGTNLNTSALALDATLTGRTQKTQITDGTRDGTVKAASTAAGATDTALVVALSPNSPTPAGTNVIGALSANQTVNIAQVNGVAVSTPGSGIQRVAVMGNGGIAMDTSNGSTVPSNSMSISLRAAAQGTTQPSAVAATNTQYPAGDTAGVLYVHPHGPVSWSCFVQGITATTQCRAAPAAGLRAYVTSVLCDNQAATVQTIDVVFGTGTNCGTGTTALTHKFQMGTNATTTSPDHVQAYFSTPLVPTAANAICARPSAATAFGCTLSGYDAP